MLIHSEKKILTTLAGVDSGNTVSLRGICYEILVKPATGTTTYNISIVNSNGMTVYERESEKGNLSEPLQLPVSGIYTISLSGATADEAFVIELVIIEK